MGSDAWCADERSSALDIARSEVEEFEFSARNEFEWLNEHMNDIFSENQMYVSDASNVFEHGPNEQIAMSPRFSKHQASFVERHRELRAS